VQAHMRDQPGWFPRKRLVDYRLSPGKPLPVSSSTLWRWWGQIQHYQLHVMWSDVFWEP
jgi:hypothetical protein